MHQSTIADWLECYVLYIGNVTDSEGIVSLGGAVQVLVFGCTTIEGGDFEHYVIKSAIIYN